MSVPAIVLGRHVTALGALRCLGRRGRQVLVATEPTELATRSRYFQPAVCSDGRLLRGCGTPEDYDVLSCMAEDRAVLIPCSDSTATWVAHRPDSLRARFVASSPSAASLGVIQDKRKFAELCRELAIPHPHYYLVESDDDLARVPLDELSNWFFKPSNSREFLACYGKKGLRFRGRREAEALWDRFSTDNISILLQEYVPGSADQHYFIDGFRDRHGVVRARLARRRYRIFPRDFGNSSYCEQIPIDQIEQAWLSLKRILEHLEYRGIFSAEFKYDIERHEYRILEINARAWLYVEFAAYCGIDVCNLAYLDALERDVPDLRETRRNAGCVNFLQDFKSVLGSPPDRRPPLPQFARQWWQARKTIFCWDDPKPLLVWLFGRLFGRPESTQRG